MEKQSVKYCHAKFLRTIEDFTVQYFSFILYIWNDIQTAFIWHSHDLPFRQLKLSVMTEIAKVKDWVMVLLSTL
jgi:hypothetical protein